MPEQTPPDEGPAAQGAAHEDRVEPEWQRRRRLAAVFGDVMPETTSDERDPETAADASAEDAGDRWLRSQVPPHHG